MVLKAAAAATIRIFLRRSRWQAPSNDFRLVAFATADDGCYVDFYWVAANLDRTPAEWQSAHGTKDEPKYHSRA